MTTRIQPFDDNYQDYLHDESRLVGKADSISFPQNHDQVCAVLTALAKEKTPVTTQGARTGISGGAAPSGGHVLNLSRMDAFLGLRQQDDLFFLRVQPGVTLAAVREALEKRSFETENWSDASLQALKSFQQTAGLLFIPDPTETTASIGGMIASNASGARSFRFGPTRNHIEGLRVALADGRGISLERGACKATGRRFALPLENGEVFEGNLPEYPMPKVKNAAGYYADDDMDMVDLFIGSEGTLGIITEAELRLIPEPGCIWGITAFLPSEEQAMRFVRALRGESVDGLDIECPEKPVALEYFDQAALALLDHARRTNPAFSEIPEMPADLPFAVYAEYHGSDEDVVMDMVMPAAELVELCGGTEDGTWTASTPAERKRLQDFRHATPELVNLRIDERKKQEPELTKLGTDMAVANRDLEKVVALYRAGLAEENLESVVFGHVGDNHVHVNILPRNLEEYERGKALYARWATEIAGMGGSVSAEHGIGKIKAAFLGIMFGPKAVRQMRDLKKIFDPDCRLNPGNLFPAGL